MRSQTREIWEKHLLAAAAHTGGIKGYCREHGIGNSRIHYWKKKLSTSCEAKAPAFARVEVVPGARQELPDPKWLAEFLLALGNRR